MAINATYRGHVDGGPEGVATSGPIPVNAGDVLVVCVVADSYQDRTTAQVTMSTGWGFNYQVHEVTYGNVSDGGYAGVFAAIPIPANGSPTITVTTSGSAQGHKRPSFDIWSITGQHSSNPVVQTTTRVGYGNPVNVTLRSAAETAGNTIAIICGADGNYAGRPYITGSGVTAGYGFTQPGSESEPGIDGFSCAARWYTPDYNQWLTIDPYGSYWPAFQALAVMEFQAAPIVPTVGAGTDRTVERQYGVIRTAGESSDGGAAITSRQWRLMSGPAGSGAPVNLAAYAGDPKQVLLPNQVAGVHVIRYTATNSVGAGYDEATITVTPRRPVVEAGPDAVMQAGTFTRTAQETAGDTATTSRRWYVVQGPSLVGSTIGSAAALSWTPPSLGRWVLGYTATNSGGTSDPDTFVLTVGVTGVPLRLGRTPEPKIAVAVAFGGDLTSVNGSTWAFTEITSDVRVAAGISLRHGASDEASSTQPAQFRCTLTNTHGRYSLGGLSPNWPNVRQGTPVQVSVNLGSGFQTIFTGYADGWSPGWSTVPLDVASGRGDATVTLVASGALRRMAQGTPPYVSPIRRGLSSASDLCGYWPCEDEKDSTVIAPARPEWNPLRFSTRLHGGSNPGLPAAKPRLAESDVFVASQPLPLVSDSEWYANIPDYTPAAGTNAIQLRFLIDVPAPGLNNESVIIGLITTGDPSFWEIRYRTAGTWTSNGQISIRAWRNFQSMVMDIDCANIGGINGRRGQLGLQLSLSGSNIRADVDFLEEGAAASAGAIQVTSGFTATVGRAVRVQTTTDGGMVDMTLGHIVVRSVITSEAENIRHLNAWTGDTVGARLTRVTADNGTWFTMLDAAVPTTTTPADYMGPQPAGTVTEILRDCEATDRGLLWDGVGPGLSYTTRRYRESRAPAVVLDAAARQVGLPFGAVHDDQRRVNRASVTRHGGSNAMYLDDTGPLGANLIGRYDTALTVGCQSDSALGQYAAWTVFQGTAEGYRFPQLTLDFGATPDLLDEWLAVVPGARIDVTGLRSITTAAPEDAVALAVEGYEQTITPRTWTARVNTSLFRRWAVACVAAETGDTQEFCARIDTSGAQLAAIAAIGATSLTVDTTKGTLWTTRADDYPLDLDLGAIKVRVTAATAGGVGGNSARQTLTLAAPLPVTRPAGTPVQLWNPPVFGL
jgi:hypothetical protein